MSAFRKIADTWRRSPAVRMVARAGATAFGAYVVDSIQKGTPFSLSAAGLAAGAAVVYAIVGLLTPLEPHVGVAKARVEVPPTR